MQIHELNTYAGALGSGSYLAIDNSTDTGKISYQELFAPTEARIDNIIAGPAPSAQEVTDARLGANGVVYPSLGDAIREQVGEITELQEYNYTVFDISWTSGYVKSADGSITSNSSYAYSQLFKVNEGDYIEYSARASASVFIVALYAASTGNADTTVSIMGSDVVHVGSFTVPSGINYIRLCGATAYQSDFYLRKYASTEKTITASSTFLNNRTINDGLLLNKGYIRASDGTIASGSYKVSKHIPVSYGEKYKIKSYGSTSVFTIGMYQSTTSNADLSRSVLGANATAENLIVIPNGINYIRVCCSDAHINDLSCTRIITTLDDVEEAITSIDSKACNAVNKRAATVSFIFDDGTANDATVKTIFDNKNKKCGFAVYAPIASRYSQYSIEGFEILAHGTSIDQTDESTVRAALKTAYDNVVNTVGECRGWITPNSALNAEYQPLVNEYYSYGYTIYKGDTATPSAVCMNAGNKSYSLWRSSIESLTLAQQKAIVDYAVENDLMICFYGHAANIDSGGNFTSANLAALLDYCDTVGIKVELPYKSVSDYLAYHHNDIWEKVSASDAGLSSKLQTVGSQEAYGWDMRYSDSLKLFCFTARLKAVEAISGSVDIANIPVSVLNQGVIVNSDSGGEVLLYNGKILFNGNWASGISYRFSVVCPIL